MSVAGASAIAVLLAALGLSFCEMGSTASQEASESGREAGPVRMHAGKSLTFEVPPAEILHVDVSEVENRRGPRWRCMRPGKRREAMMSWPWLPLRSSLQTKAAGLFSIFRRLQRLSRDRSPSSWNPSNPFHCSSGQSFT